MNENEKLNLIKAELKNILSNSLTNLELFEKCRFICKNRYYTGLDPFEELFQIFIDIESELDQYPTNLPNYAADKNYLRKCKNTVESYIESSKKDIFDSSRTLLSKLEKDPIEIP